MNATERLVADALTRAGCQLFRRGWPDFLVLTPGGSLVAVEVKSSSDTLRPEQRLVMEALASHGVVTCVVTVPDLVEDEREWRTAWLAEELPKIIDKALRERAEQVPGV